MGRLRYWPFVGAMAIVAGLATLTLNYGPIMSRGVLGLAWALGFTFAALVIPGLAAIWSFRETRERAPRLPAGILGFIVASLVADRWSDLAQEAGTYGGSAYSVMMLALSIGGGLLAFTAVCILAGLFRDRERPPQP